MKKLRPIIFGAFSTVAVVAPIAAVISCGESTSSTNTQPTANAPKPNESYQVHTDGKYTLTSLTDEAKRYSDNSEWKPGLTFHAEASMFSFLRALAEKYGYSSVKDANGNTRRDIDQSSGNVFVSASGQVVGTPTANQQKTINVLKTLKQTKDSVTNQATNGTFGDDGAITFDRLGYLNISSTYTLSADANDEYSIAVDNKGDANVASSLSFNWYSMYDNQSLPGSTVLLLHDSNTDVSFEMVIKGVQSAYPKIDSTDFQAKLVPSIRNAYADFINLWSTTASKATITQGSQFGIYSDANFFKQITFLIEKTFKAGVFTPDANFDTYLNQLNASGNIHWLAIKAADLGFDKTLSTGLVAPFATNSVWKYGTDFIGIKDMTNVKSFINWTNYSTFKKGTGNPTSVADNTDFSFTPLSNQAANQDLKRVTFVANKSVEDSLKASGYSDDDIKTLQLFVNYNNQNQSN